MKIVIASGKGGVGKSMVASSLALLFSKEKKVLAVDCDVDAANLGLWLGIEKFEREWKVSTSEKAVINENKCTGCGKCFEACKFNSIDKKNEKFEVNGLLCEGCRVCELVCPVGAVSHEKVFNGLIQVNKKDLPFPLVSGKLLPGERCSGKIVTEVRKEADKFEHKVMVLDSAAGIGCTVNASVLNTDYAVLVTEPTPSGLSDLKRIIEVLGHFRIPFGAIVNQWDINPEFSMKIEEFAGEKLLGKIGHDRKVIESIVALKPVMESNGKAAGEIREIFTKLKKDLNL